RTAHVQGVPLAVVELGGATTSEAIVLERGARGLSQLVRLPVGGSGLDHEYGYDHEIDDKGIYKVQTRSGFTRCDGKPAYLFAEAYNRATGKFQRVARVPTMVPDAAPVIAA